MHSCPAEAGKVGVWRLRGISAPDLSGKHWCLNDLQFFRKIYPPPALRPYASRMTDWRTPPTEGFRDTASLLARMEGLEARALEIAGDEARDPGFLVIAALVKMMLALQGVIHAAERWNRRLARKREMLAGKALRMNMCDRLGGVGALERWEAWARERLAGAGLADRGSTRDGDSGMRRDDGEGEGLEGEGREGEGLEGEREDNGRTSLPHHISSPRRRRAVQAAGSFESGERGLVREFALPRLPHAGMQRRRKPGGARAPARHETPIAVWPCEVMPERFAREWWRTPGPRHGAGKHRTHTPESNRHKPARSTRDLPHLRAKAGAAKVGGPGSNMGTNHGGCCERGRAPPC